VNLAQGFPDFPAPAVIKEAATKAILADLNQYAITWGEPNLRQAIAEKFAWYNGVIIDPEREITVCCGSTEAVPGSSFYSRSSLGKTKVRFCFPKKTETLEQAAERLRKFKKEK